MVNEGRRTVIAEVLNYHIIGMGQKVLKTLDRLKEIDL